MTLTQALAALVAAGKIRSAWLAALYDVEPLLLTDAGKAMRLGCLLAIACEAWGDPWLAVLPYKPKGVWAVLRWAYGDHGGILYEDEVAHGPTEASAIEAAIIAAAEASR